MVTIYFCKYYCVSPIVQTVEYKWHGDQLDHPQAAAPAALFTAEQPGKRPAAFPRGTGALFWVSTVPSAPREDVTFGSSGYL